MIIGNNPASSLPRGRLERLARLGGLAGRVAGDMLAVGMRQVARGNLPRAAVMKLFVLATEPARTRGRFDFGASDLAIRILDAGMALSFEQGYWHTPPADAVFLHRKLGRLYLLAARLRARVDVRIIL